MVMRKKVSAVKSKSSRPKGRPACKVDEGQLNRMIQDRAYYIWEEWGRPGGKDSEIWVQAEKEMRRKVRR